MKRRGGWPGSERVAPIGSSPRDRLLVALALFAVCVIWGSTYLGIKIGLEGFPPFFLNGIRLVVAGGVLYLWAAGRGMPRPTARQWRNAAFVGGLMFVGGMGLVTLAEDGGVGSGLVAAAVAVMPLWAALWAGLFGVWPTRIEWMGLTVGLVGVVMLSREGDFQAEPVAMLMMVLSPMIWALASVLAGRVDLPRGAMASATQMFGGGALMLVFGVARGETISVMPGLGAWLALGYLITAGSLITFTAYLYLLANTRPAVATSYAYVNPVVAVAFGVTLGDEIVGAWTYLGLPVILAGVALVGFAQRRRPGRELRRVRSARTAAGTP